MAATANRVYCTTDFGQLVAIDAQTGHGVGEFPLNWTDQVFTNNQTDRIYVATLDGGLQCLTKSAPIFPTLHLVERPGTRGQNPRGRQDR